ncbi:MAG: hypothetical protein M0R77_02195 [Gammaproteobacteria bacterium]|nr:hypothetical protein [Gammaproteobacteria bacterium]
MTAVFIEGFDYYTASGSGSALPLTSRWTISNAGSTLITTGVGRYPNSQAMYMNSNISASSSFAQTQIGSTLTSLSVGFAAKIVAYTQQNTILEIFNSTGGLVQFRLDVTTDGALQIKSGPSTVVATSSNGVIPLNTWVYIEFEAVLNSASGRLSVYVNDTQAVSNSLDTTTLTGGDFIKFYTNSLATWYIDDVYINNTATKLGESRVIVLSPNADTAQKNFQTNPTGLAGNYDAVNGLTVDNSSFIYGGTQGWKDIYDIDDMSFNPLKIHGIQPVYTARKDDAATIDVRVNLTVGSTTVNGTTNNLLMSQTDFYRYSDPILTVNPDTGLAWKSTDINNLKMGPEIL